MSTRYYLAEFRDDAWDPVEKCSFIVHGAAGGGINITWTQLPGPIFLALLDNAEDRLSWQGDVAFINDHEQTVSMSTFYSIIREAQHQTYEPAAV